MTLNNIFFRLLCTAFLFLALIPTSSGQDIKLVEGRVINTADGKPIGDVQVFPYNTIADAQDIKREIERHQKEKTEEYFDPKTIASYTDIDGYFKTNVASTGAIVFYVEMSEPVLVKINGKLQINVSMAIGHKLNASVVTASIDANLPIIETPTGNDEMFTAGAVFPLPNRTGKTDGRIVLQTYVIEVGSRDTVKFNDPVVMDGVDYHNTQLRRMAFVKERDPLYNFAEKNTAFDESVKHIRCRDTVKIIDPKKTYLYRAKLWAEDYIHEYYSIKDTTLGRSDRLAKPMRFLQYDLKQYKLNPDDFRKTPLRERRGTSGNIHLKFLVGKAEIDSKDSVSLLELEKLRQQLRNTMSDEGATLKDFHIHGYASPEGQYAKNLDLASRRMKYVSNQIMSVIPKYTFDRVYKTAKAEVESWNAVADLLYADSLKTEAAKVREIASSGTRSVSAASMDSQWAKIRSLPFYRDKIVPRLASLRSVKYNSTIEIYRELTPEEILEKYKSDPDYRNGKKEIPLYEYWHLFNMVEDPEELEQLYRMAYEDSNHTWELPANNLALSLISKDIADTTILAPFIDFKYRINMVLTKNGRFDRAYNNDVIVANQVIMFIIAKKYIRAAQIAYKLPDNKYHDLIQITKCLAGFWKTDKQLREDVRNSSAINKIVMDLAEGWLGRAEEELEDLPKDKPLYHYLKAQILCRKHNGFFDMSISDDLMAIFTDKEYAASALCTAIQMDRSYLETAQSDAYIYEDLVSLAIKYLEEGDPTKEQW